MKRLLSLATSLSASRRDRISSRLKQVLRRRRRDVLRFEALEDRRVLAGTITGRVWIDANYNGQQDATETQNGSVTVQLVSSGNVITQSTTTNGTYTLSNVPTTQLYEVRFTLPAGFTLGPTAVGADATNNDFSVDFTAGATVAYKSFVQAVDGQTIKLDAGIVQGANLTAFAWNDANANGLQDTGAPEATGQAGVTVTLIASNGFTYAQQGVTTGANGLATFTNIRPGNYILNFSHSTLKRTLQDQGTDDNIDSDAEQTQGNTAVFSLAPGTTRTNVDAGFNDGTLLTGKITGKAWLDNGDGIRQTTETTLTGTQIFELYRSTNTIVGDADDQFVTSAATDANQNYQLAGITPGNYYVRPIVPTNYAITLQNQGGNDAVDSDFSVATGNTALIVISAGVTVANVDVGFLPGTASIGNFIWNDIDRDGIQDVGEAGLAGAVVKLFNANNAQVGTAITTTSTGAYLFSGLQPGQYTVRVTPPVGYLATLKDKGTSDTLDSDIDTVTLSTATITLTAGMAATQWDAGFYLGAKVGDRVWIDTNRNGIQNPDEVGKAGVSVSLKSLGTDGYAGTADDVTVAQTSTDSNGVYAFNGVTNGTYYVQFGLPSGFVFTKRDAGTSDVIDSDAGVLTGRTAAFTITNFQSNLTIDAGLVPANSITVHVGPDPNCTGVLVPGAIPGIDVCLFDPGINSIPGDDDDTFIVKSVTDASGNVTFPNLRPGNYYIRTYVPQGYRLSPPNKGTSEDLDSDVIFFCSGYGNTGVITLGTVVTSSITVGLCQLPGAIEGVVWNDVNGNKIREGALLQGSTPDVVLAIDVSGSTSELYAGTAIGDYNNDGFADTYLDAQVAAAYSLISQMLDSGFGASRFGIVAYNGTAKNLDLNPLTSGIQTFARLDADTNANGLSDVGEALTTLRSGGGSNFEAALQTSIATITAMSTVSGRGNLLFFTDGVPTTGGTYSDEVATLHTKNVRINGYVLGRSNALPAIQSIDPRAAVFATVDDFYSRVNLNRISGFATERGMGGVTVFLDTDNDGVLDASEVQTETWFDDPDTIDFDETGLYRFDGLTPGDYVVREVIPTGYTQTLPGATGFAWNATVVGGRSLMNADFGNTANPKITGIASSVAYKAGTATTLIASAAAVGDVDTPYLKGGVLSVRVTNAQSSDRLTVSSVGTATGQVSVAVVSGVTTISYGNVVIATATGGTGSTALAITFNSSASRAAVQAVIRRISFNNTLATPSTTTRSVSWSLTDGFGGSTQFTQSITVSL